MNSSLILKLLRLCQYVSCFVGIFLGTSETSKKKYTAGLRKFVGIGVLPLSIFSAIRHIIFNGNIIKSSTPFFEIEAGGANLAVAIASIVALIQKMDNNSLALICLVYAVYLSTSLVAWIIYIVEIKKIKKIAMIAGFTGIISALLYFASIGFIHDKDEDEEN
jgi:hypothetical protein